MSNNIEVSRSLGICSLVMVGIIAVFLLSQQQYINSILTEEEAAVKEKEKMNIKWNVYNNSEYGFSIKYPEVMGEPRPSYFDFDWSSEIPEIRNAPHSIYFSNPNHEENPYMTYIKAELNVYPADHFDKTLKQFMYEDFFNTHTTESPVGFPVTTTIADNITGYELTTVGLLESVNKFVGFVNGDYIYTFGSEQIDTAIGKLVYDEMKKSIKLFNPTPISSNNGGSDSNSNNEEDDN